MTFGYAEKIDVVIPSIRRDLYTLETCISYAKKNIKNIGRIIVVSPEKLTEKAEWFDENDYPFSKQKFCDVLNSYINSKEEFKHQSWCYQQLLKLYAHKAIDNLSETFVVLDSDTFILKPWSPKDDQGRFCFHVARESVTFSSYIHHMQNLIPHTKVFPTKTNPVINYMVFSQSILNDMFQRVEDLHKVPFWEAFAKFTEKDAYFPCKLSNASVKNLFVGASEFTVYFFFVTNYYPKAYSLKYITMCHNISSLQQIPLYKNHHFQLISCPYYHRKPIKLGN